MKIISSNFSRSRRSRVHSGVRQAEGDAGEGAEARSDDETADAEDGPRKVEGKTLTKLGHRSTCQSWAVKNGNTLQ